jgi:hypothetical protein
MLPYGRYYALLGMGKTTKKTNFGGIMENVKWEVKDNKLIVEVDLSVASGLSKSGKTITIASTKGNQKIEGTDAIIGLNVYKYPDNA